MPVLLATIKKELLMFAMLHIDQMWNRALDPWGQKALDQCISMLQTQSEVEQELSAAKMQ